MLKPSIDDLVQTAGSRYSLVIAASKRARKIVEGEKALIESDISNPVSVAAREIAAGKVIVKK
jgi:DNA-directed RNA polymerase subunit omega